MGFDRLFQVLLLFWPVAASVRTFRKMAEESCTCSLVTIMLKKLSSRSFAIKVKWSCGHNMFIHLMQNFLRKYVSLPDVKIVPLSPVLIYQLLDFIGSDAMPPIGGLSWCLFKNNAVTDSPILSTSHICFGRNLTASLSMCCIRSLGTKQHPCRYCVHSASGESSPVCKTRQWPDLQGANHSEDGESC